MGYSSSLSDQEWEIIEPLLPRKKKTRPPTWTKRQIWVFYIDKPFHPEELVNTVNELLRIS